MEIYKANRGMENSIMVVIEHYVEGEKGLKDRRTIPIQEMSRFFDKGLNSLQWRFRRFIRKVDYQSLKQHIAKIAADTLFNECPSLRQEMYMNAVQHLRSKLHTGEPSEFIETSFYTDVYKVAMVYMGNEKLWER